MKKLYGVNRERVSKHPKEVEFPGGIRRRAEKAENAYTKSRDPLKTLGKPTLPRK